MVLKKYNARSIVSIGLEGFGAIDFIADTKGGSYYSTTDETLQGFIESSVLYRDGVIKIVGVEELGVRSEELGVEKGEKGLKGEKAINELGVRSEELGVEKVYTEVTKCVDAISILRNEYGVTEVLNSKVKILEAAKSVGVSFPKL